jgi:thiamine biosynthesis protein ThiS
MPLLELAMEATSGGVDAIYLRDVDLPADGLARLVENLRQRIGERVSLLVNGSPEAAREIGTGLHLRERGVTAAGARAVLGPEVLIGRSVHSPEGAIAAAGADYMLAGHVYPSTSKPGLAPLGIAGLAAIVAAAPCPVLAIGGITPGRVAEVIRTGALGVAVIGAIVEANDPRAAAGTLRSALDRALEIRETEPSMDESPGAADNATTIDIIVNGKAASVSAGATVHDFLVSKRMTDAMAIVERNGEIVPRARYGITALEAEDQLEVVHAVGGG